MSSVDKVALYQEAADALRTQANAVEAAIQALEEANTKVIQLFSQWMTMVVRMWRRFQKLLHIFKRNLNM